MQVIATAGHVDHGKSTLLRALTGMEPDRWEEERRRGLTLDLGFVWTDELTFVDVPGHERFITTMLAGVGSVPAVLFVVAADGGWQVQSEEHLAICDALGITHGVLAVTRSDLADPSSALAESAGRLAGTTLADIAAIPVSAVTGFGLERLRAALAAMPVPQPDPEGDIRLWIDRVFTLAGHGTVVTGTLAEGTMRVGDAVHVAGEPLRVRGLHSRGQACDQITGCARVAVNLRGDTEGLRRGNVLVSPGRWLEVTHVDVRLGGPGMELGRVPVWLTWHQGTAAVPARVRMLGTDTARVTLPGLPVRIGDRVLLREPSSRRIWGGTVLDVRPPDLRRRGGARVRALELESMNGRPDLPSELRRRGLITRSELAMMGVRPNGAPVVGDWLADPDHWANLRARLAELAGDQGIGQEEARRALNLADRALVDALAAEVGLRRLRGRLVPAEPALPVEIDKALATVARGWLREPFVAPSGEALAELGLGARELAMGEMAGRLLRVSPGVVLPPDAAERAITLLRTLPQPFTTAQARQVLQTTRRVAIPLLEHLDRLGLTRRRADFSRDLVDR
ncbi:SelB domain-containing protein [Nonomuraea helvata]|uniref:SelB C-terminal domain-containing protein n=1 Tax=Nonomuraea helvata TaxID=37484 RepID=A0ABV5RRK2_9ACTN